VVAACSYTAPVEKSGTALRLLRKEPPNADDLLTLAQFQRNSRGRILGAVRRVDGRPVLDAKVYIWNESDSSYERPGWPANEEWPGDKDGAFEAFLLARFTSVDKNGAFESDFLVPGAYRVTAVDE
jgi:protocatechuate 3,4-dioxygenase beta subunit